MDKGLTAWRSMDDLPNIVPSARWRLRLRKILFGQVYMNINKVLVFSGRTR